MATATAIKDALEAADKVEIPKSMDVGIIEAGGRYFVARGKTTIRQNGYLATLLEQSDFEALKHHISETGTMSDLAIAIIKKAYENDTIHDIIGALLTETDQAGEPLPLTDKYGRPQRWTVEKAREIASFVANIEEPDEQERFNAIITAVLILFFTSGVESLMNSPNSSAEGPDLQGIQISSATPNPAGSSADVPSDALLAKVLAAGDLDPSITGSGTTSSAPSPGTTPTPSNESPTGTS